MILKLFIIKVKTETLIFAKRYFYLVLRKIIILFFNHFNQESLLQSDFYLN